ncbi:hypothetical protein GB937_008799 [Aspergillus fischeri]|nr:hypothetical protein GB937_008799 [Aspergillus fischeri]
MSYLGGGGWCEFLMSEAPKHGKKRPAENDPDGDQPLAKKFGRLQIVTLRVIIHQHRRSNFDV